MKLKPGETLAMYVDVDGTLLFWPGNKPGRRPRPSDVGYRDEPKINEPLVKQIKEWHRNGRVLVLWSRGGTDACRYAAKLCGLTPDACLPKPRIVVDDGARSIAIGTGFIFSNPHERIPEVM